jgi:hypothetical protein
MTDQLEKNRASLGIVELVDLNLGKRDGLLDGLLLRDRGAQPARDLVIPVEPDRLSPVREPYPRRHRLRRGEG